ncbi:MAG: ABC transporter permease, partial [Planctomycetota bacterium]
MKRSTLIRRSLTHYWRTNLGVALGAAVASTVLICALVVVDSLRFSLARIALQRLGGTHAAMATGERLFTDQLGAAFAGDPAAAVALDLPALARTLGADSREANDNVHLIGVDDAFWKLADASPPAGFAEPDSVAINTHLADKLEIGLGDRVQFRITKPSALSRDMPLGSENDESIRLNLNVGAILDDDTMGRFSLRANQIPPFNAFVPLSVLQDEAQTPGRANTVLIGGAESQDEAALGAAMNRALREGWALADASVELRELTEQGVIELRSDRVFLDDTMVAAARSVGGAEE